MKGIIVYKGKYGATFQYAQWLGSELQLPVIETEHMTAENIVKYDYVIIGSSVYVGKLLVREWIKRYMPVLQSKKVFIFIVCATGKSAEEMLVLLNERLQNNPVEEIKIAMDEQIRITKLRLEKLFES